MVLAAIALLSLYYYESQRKLMLSDKRATMAQYAYVQVKRLKVLHYFFPERTTYPRDPSFTSAIYDIEYNKIFSLNKREEHNFDNEISIKDGYIHFVKGLDTYYLGTRYLVIEIPEDKTWAVTTWKHIVLYGGAAFVLFMLLGLYLAKRFLKPMRDSIMLLDRFIKDTTHELNTPLAAILANIETMDKSVMIDKNRKKLERIDIAARTVSTLYKDLTFLTLEQEKENEDEPVDVAGLIADRVEYFEVLARSKQIGFKLDLDAVTVVMDRRKLTRVIDNLISNAIKYNKRGGSIEVVLDKEKLSIRDTGIGIAEEKIPLMFDRYLRFNSSEGGFGVGLSIVKKILDEYGLEVAVDSKEGKGMTITIYWKDEV